MKRYPFARDFSLLSSSRYSMLHTKMALVKFWCAGYVFLANTYFLKSVTQSQEFSNYQKGNICAPEFRSEHFVCNMVLDKGPGSLIKRDLFISLSGQTVM